MGLSEEALSDNDIHGGTMVLAMGGFGSGKSKLLQSWAIEAFERGHLVVMRSKDVDTWQDLSSRYPLHVYTPDIYSFKFQDEKQRQNITFTMIRRPDDIVKHLKKEEINIIAVNGPQFAQEFFWGWFSIYLAHNSEGWTTFCFDEMSDVYPSKPSGESYWASEYFVGALKSFRKAHIHLRASVHTFHDLYYEILYKFDYTAYLKKATLLPKKRTALKYRTPIQDNCDYEHYILDNVSEFSIVHHSMLPEHLATKKTVTIDGPDFRPENFPIEAIRMGITPLIECPSCGRNLHMKSEKRKCPYCGEELILADSIALGTPSVDYNGKGEGGGATPHRSIEKNSIKAEAGAGSGRKEISRRNGKRGD